MEIIRRQDVSSNSHLATRRNKPLLSMYYDPPTEEMTLHEFETWGFDRLQGLVWSLAPAAKR